MYFNERYKKYAFFVTGEEHGGMVDYYSRHDTEEEAFTALYEYMNLLSRENKGLGMNKHELERRLQKESLLEFQGDDGVKRYVDGDDFFYDNVFHNRPDIFGVYKNGDGKFRAFITDAERGYPKYGTIENTEEEACEWLYEFVRTYQL